MDLLTVSEASKLLKLSKSKIYDLCSTGKLPAVKIGGSVRIIADELATFLDTNRVKAEGTPPRPRPRLKRLSL